MMRVRRKIALWICPELARKPAPQAPPVVKVCPPPVRFYPMYPTPEQTGSWDSELVRTNLKRMEERFQEIEEEFPDLQSAPPKLLREINALAKDHDYLRAKDLMITAIRLFSTEKEAA